MASPELSFTEPLSVVESAGAPAPNSNFLSEPARFTTFFEFDASQRDTAVDELLEQARQSGFEPVNQLPESAWPLAKYTATDAGDIMLSITVSESNLGVELR